MYLMYTIFVNICLQLVLCDATKNSATPKTRKPRILGGQESSINRFPHLVNLDYDLKQNCGGSILTPFFIITAAHCVHHDPNPNLYKVRAGSTFRNRGGSVHYIRNIIEHPDYKHSRVNPLNDLAALRLLNPIDLDNVIKKSISMFEFGRESLSGSTTTIAGWGCTDKENEDLRPEHLWSLDMKIVGKSQCKDIYKNDVPLNQGEICASAASRNDGVTRGFCKGDSGGPLVIGDKLAGVAKSTGPTHDSKVWPNKFTEVSFYRKWLDGVVDFGLKVSKSIYDWPINKIDDLKRIVPEVYDNQSVILFELHGHLSRFSGLQQLLRYCSEPVGVQYKLDSYQRFDEPTDARIKELLDGVNIKPKCNSEFVKQRTSLRKKLFPELCKEITNQLKSTKKLPHYNDLEDVENKIKDCMRNNNAQSDRSCGNVEKKVREIDSVIQTKLSLIQNVGEFAIKKNKVHVDSLINEYVVKPVEKCNGTP